MKSNTASSSGDMSSFSSAKHSKPKKKPMAGKKAKRPGKARRQKMRSRVKR